MSQSPHNRVAELHNLAAHAHTAAAVAHGKGDHLTAHELSKQAMEVGALGALGAGLYSIGIPTVSYTHLDVYKRQSCAWCEILPFSMA